MTDFDIDMGGASFFSDSGTNRKALMPEKHLSTCISVDLINHSIEVLKLAIKDDPSIRPFGKDDGRIRKMLTILDENPDINHSGIKSTLPSFHSALNQIDNFLEILTPHYYPALYNMRSKTAYRLQSDSKLATKIYNIEKQSYIDWIKTSLNLKECKKLGEKLDCYLAVTDKGVDTTSRSADLWSKIVDAYRANYPTGQCKRYDVGKLKFLFTKGLVFIKSKDTRGWKVMVYEQLQMIQDCVLARHNVELSLNLNLHNGTQELPIFHREIIRWQEMCLEEYGNDGFELVKAPEALFKTKINSLNDGDVLPISSLSRTINKIKKKEFKLRGENSSPMVDHIEKILSRVTHTGDAAELFGIAKMSGHPIVDARRSGKEVFAINQSKGKVSSFGVIMIERCFKHLFLSGYIRRHKLWPNFANPPKPGTK